MSTHICSGNHFGPIEMNVKQQTCDASLKQTLFTDILKSGALQPGGSVFPLI